MKPFIAVLVLASFVCAENVNVAPGNPVYGYLKNFAIPEAERIRKAEASQAASRIVGGVPAGVAQYEYQVGLLISIIGLESTGVCGGSLVSANRVITAAHCWFDGISQGWRITAVLGSTTLFSGGTRVDTSVVAMHPSWFPSLVRNDVAVIYIPSPVSFSSTIGPIALPSRSEFSEDFIGKSAIASGFGITSDGGFISANQILSHVNLNVISNRVCSLAFPLIVQPSNICTSGIGGVGACRGDSGGPLVVTRNNRRILIGVVSFGSGIGCQINLPAVYARTTSYIDFFNQHM